MVDGPLRGDLCPTGPVGRRTRVTDLRPGRYVGRSARYGVLRGRDVARHASRNRARLTAGRQPAHRRRRERCRHGARRQRRRPVTPPVAGHQHRPALRGDAVAGRDHRLAFAVVRGRPDRLPLRRCARRAFGRPGLPRGRAGHRAGDLRTRLPAVRRAGVRRAQGAHTGAPAAPRARGSAGPAHAGHRRVVPRGGHSAGLRPADRAARSRAAVGPAHPGDHDRRRLPGSERDVHRPAALVAPPHGCRGEHRGDGSRPVPALHHGLRPPRPVGTAHSPTSPTDRPHMEYGRPS